MAEGIREYATLGSAAFCTEFEVAIVVHSVSSPFGPFAISGGREGQLILDADYHITYMGRSISSDFDYKATTTDQKFYLHLSIYSPPTAMHLFHLTGNPCIPFKKVFFSRVQPLFGGRLQLKIHDFTTSVANKTE